MKNITLYTLSLLLTITAGLIFILMPIDEIYSSFFLTIFAIILACITRVFSKDQTQKSWDLIVLFAVIIPMFFVRLFPPMTIFFVSFDQTFLKVIAGIIIFISIIQLIVSQKEQSLMDKTKERKNNIKIFFTTLILMIISFFGLDLYGKGLDLNTTLSGNERIYLYSYGKYTPQLIETAFKDVESSNDQITQKMAIEYIGKMPSMNDQERKRLEDVVFLRNISGPGFESQIGLMIKLNPQKTIEVLENVNKDSGFNAKLVSLNFLYIIAKNNPSLENEVCVTGNDLYQSAKKQIGDSNYNITRLDLLSYGGNIKSLCKIK